MLITSGTADGANDEALLAAMEQAANTGVLLSLVHVGDNPVDQTLSRRAATIVDANRPEDLAAAITQATGHIASDQ